MSITRRLRRIRIPTDSEVPSGMSHYLYFDAQAGAIEVAAMLEERRFSTALQPASESGRWLVVAKHLLADWRGNSMPPSDYFEAIASHFDGQYGGWEIGPMTGVVAANSSRHRLKTVSPPATP